MSEMQLPVYMNCLKEINKLSIIIITNILCFTAFQLLTIQQITRFKDIKLVKQLTYMDTAWMFSWTGGQKNLIFNTDLVLL